MIKGLQMLFPEGIASVLIFYKCDKFIQQVPGYISFYTE